MDSKNIINNQVTVVGVVEREFIFSHRVRNSSFYTTFVNVKRLSGVSDIIPIMASEYLLNVNRNITGKEVILTGMFRSRIYFKGGEGHLELFLFTKSINLENTPDESIPNNQIHLDGYICKEPVYRKTPLGREVTDLFLAVNRPGSRSDYIPCICWGMTARYAGGLMIGEQCTITGRIQSRNYTKKTENQETIKTAYEVSVFTLQMSEPVSEARSIG